MSFFGDVFHSSKLRVARSAESGKLIVIVSHKSLPASMYLPAVIGHKAVAVLVIALLQWLRGEADGMGVVDEDDTVIETVINYLITKWKVRDIHDL